MAQSLVNDGLLADQREKVDVIPESGKTPTALLNDVDLSKIEAGKMEIACTDGELGQTFERLRQLFLSKAVERGLNIDLSIAPGMPAMLHYDPVRVRQCVGNLLSNAIKLAERGQVKMAVSSEEGGGPLLARQRCDHHDTGIGMTEAVRSRLFTTFTQADATITRRFGGTGSSARHHAQLAQLMGGDVAVDSEPGIGSTFTPTFMADAVNEMAPSGVRRAAIPGAERADDEAPARHEDPAGRRQRRTVRS